MSFNPVKWFRKRRLRKRVERMLPVAVQSHQRLLVNHAARIAALERLYASNARRSERLKQEFERALGEMDELVERAEKSQAVAGVPERGNGSAV